MLCAADRDGALRLHVRVDERGAGFLALGLAKASGRPVAVVTTSGTAVANLHPAVLEASHSHVPLVVVSADRPAALRWHRGQPDDPPAGPVRHARAGRGADRGRRAAPYLRFHTARC